MTIVYKHENFLGYYTFYGSSHNHLFIVSYHNGNFELSSGPNEHWEEIKAEVMKHKVFRKEISR